MSGNLPKGNIIMKIQSKKRIIFISVGAACLLITAALLFSRFAPISFDKWIYTSVLGKRDFENQMYLDNVEKMFERFDICNLCFYRTDSRLERGWIYDYVKGSYSNDEKITFDKDKMYGAVDIVLNDKKTVTVNFIGTRRWYFDYKWEIVYNDELPNLNYGAVLAEDIPLAEVSSS